MIIIGNAAQVAQATAILEEYVPERIRTFIENAGTRIEFAREGETLSGVVKRVTNGDFKMLKGEKEEDLDTDSCACFQPAANAIFYPNVEPDAGTLLHEMGHAFDSAMGCHLGGRPCLVTESRIIIHFCTRYIYGLINKWEKGGLKDDEPVPMDDHIVCANNPQELIAEGFRGYCNGPKQNLGIYPVLDREDIRRDLPWFYFMFRETANGRLPDREELEREERRIA